MPLSVNPATTEPEQTIAVLTDVRNAFRVGQRLFAAPRHAIVEALDAAGIADDSLARVAVTETLTVAAAYEADGMFAFMPDWDLLLTRVNRLHRPASSDHI